MKLSFCTALVAIIAASPVHSQEAPVRNSPQTGGKLKVYPSEIRLSDGSDWNRLLVLAERSDGSTVEVTSSASFTVGDSSVVRLMDGIVQPAADGSTEIQVCVGTDEVIVPVTAFNSDVIPELSFRTDVLATLTKAGCNTGKCHGSASGKDGFRLSLFGYDPAGDHYRLTRELPGRRINVQKPEDSLLINKALGNVDHTGGQLIVDGTPEYETLVSWMNAGAPADPADRAVPTGIRVYPEEAVFADKGETQSLMVIARFSDGTDRDVTNRSVFISNNDTAASVREGGAVSSNGRGSAFIMARFDQFTEGCSIIVRPGTRFTPPVLTSNNYIDDLVQARWRDLHLVPSEVCSDEVFLRRVYIDLIGLLPDPQERAEFLADPDSNKRSRVVDELLARPDFQEMWVMKWAEMLQIRTVNGVSPKGLQLYDRWLRDRIHSGATIDQVVQELIPATGGTFDNPATSYYQTETTPQLLAENIAQAFLGTRIQCAQCHNHPFDRWTMDDYYGFAAFFSQVGYKQAQDPREIMVFNAAAGNLRHPVDDRPVVPTYLGAGPAKIPKGADYREVLASWLASDANPAFARNVSNVVWSHFFGVGIVEPVDDIRVSNPPSNPELLKELGSKLTEYRYDIRPLIRDICTSQAYQLSTTRNESNKLDERHFSHGRIRRMRAEVLLDCLNQVTETSSEFRGLPKGSRAIQIADGATPNYFLSTFGRASRATACSCEVRTSPTLSQALHLLNGETTTGKIAEGHLIERLLERHSDPMTIVTLLYERCVSRQPTEEEAAAISERLKSATDINVSLTDLFWALLNSNEFIFNH